jgi:hypothetical protein
MSFAEVRRAVTNHYRDLRSLGYDDLTAKPSTFESDDDSEIYVSLRPGSNVAPAGEYRSPRQ